MRELVAVDRGSLDRVEAFLGDVAGRPVSLGRVWLAVGPVGWLVAGMSRASAVTIDRVIFVGRRQARAYDGDALGLLGPLLVHECVHVWQYSEYGLFGFLSKYIKDYIRQIRNAGSLKSTTRRAAYFAIPFEMEAYVVEATYRERGLGHAHTVRTEPGA